MEVERWIDAAKQGDLGAFNRLVGLHQGLLYGIAYRQLGNADDALDACQEALFSAWRAMARFEGGAAKFRAWLLRILVNACRDRQRLEGRKQELPLALEYDGEVFEMELPDPGQTPEAYAEVGDLRALLEGAIGQLPEEQRTVVLLDHAGLDYAAIAEILGIEVGTVKSRLSRARGRLRDILGGRELQAAPRRSDGAHATAAGDTGTDG